jgi:hypothetical protein
MSQHDGQLPEDLRDIAERLSAARVTPSPFELDELCRRVYRRVERGRRLPRRSRFATAPRMNFVAVLLTLGLVLTSGVGVVLASGAIGGGPNTYEHFSFQREDDSSCYVEHPGSWSSNYSWKTQHSTLKVTVVWDCKELTVHVSCGEPITYKWGGGPWYDTKRESYTTTASSGTSGFSVTADGSTHTLPFVW